MKIGHKDIEIEGKKIRVTLLQEKTNKGTYRLRARANLHFARKEKMIDNLKVRIDKLQEKLAHLTLEE